MARDLSLALLLVAVGLCAIVGGATYNYITHIEKKELRTKTKDISDTLVRVLTNPLWNLDEQETEKILKSYLNSDFVTSLRLIDDNKNQLFYLKKPNFNEYRAIKRKIYYNKSTYLGELEIIINNSRIQERQYDLMIYTLLLLLVLTLGIMSATNILLKAYLGGPLHQLYLGLSRVAGGDYSFRLPHVPQLDLQSINNKVNTMAQEIANREMALQDNHRKLEILNQAILDLFSCSDSVTLMKTAISICERICQTRKAYFVAHHDVVASDRISQENPLSSFYWERGKWLELDSQKLESLPIADEILHFKFQIKSKSRSLGALTFSYQRQPSNVQTSLLKSIINLTDLALTRQAFITENAFHAAELHVAETVQKSMLPDASYYFRSCDVSWHYEPVLNVGGDWFNIIESRDGSRVLVLVGDVTGHGLPQGLVTTAVAGALSFADALAREYGEANSDDPAKIITILNRLIKRIAGKAELRMTCVAMRIDYKKGILEVCNAGHTFPILLSCDDGSTKAIPLVKEQQPILGEESPAALIHRYINASYKLGSDDLITVFTDGLTEAKNLQGKTFQRHFQRIIAKIDKPLPASHLQHHLIKQFKEFTKGGQVDDDICLLVIGSKKS